MIGTIKSHKNVFVFDLDGTLAESKSPVEEKMIDLLRVLLRHGKIAIITGGDFKQIQKQLISKFICLNGLENLIALPTCGSKMFTFNGYEWIQEYSYQIEEDHKTIIINKLEQVIKNLGFNTTQTWGEKIEDRGSQITFSALGQEAPYEEKKLWDPDVSKRRKIKESLEKSLGKELSDLYDVNIGGSTSLDITKKGIDKAFGINKLTERYNFNIENMIFVGDSLFSGGNDESVKKTGIETIQVQGPQETMFIIKTFLTFFVAS